MSHSNRLDVSPLLIPAGDHTDEALIVSIAHVTPEEEQSLGKLLVLVSLKHPNAQEITQLIQDELKTNYYAQLDDNIEVAFENALRQTNERIHAYVQSSSGEWLDDVQAAVVVLHGSTIVMTHLGSVHLFLLHGTTMVNILERTQTESETVNPLKLFSHTVSGSLNENDQLIVTTPSVLDYLSLDRLKTILQKNSPAMASVSLERLLTPNVATTSFGAIIVRHLPARAATIMSPEHATASSAGSGTYVSKSSMEELHAMESNAHHVLKPSIWPFVGNTVKVIWSPTRRFLERANILESHKRPQRSRQAYWIQRESTFARRRQRVPRRNRWQYVLGRLLSGIAYLVGGIRRGIVWIVQAVQGKRDVRKRIEHLPQKAEETVSKKVLEFKGLTPRRKTLLAVVIVALFIFSLTIVIRGASQRSAKELNDLRATIAGTQTNVSDAEAAVLYGDEARARNLLAQAQQTLDAISDKHEKRVSDEMVSAQAAIDALREAMRKVTRLPSPSQVAVAPANTTPASIGLITDTAVYVVDGFGAVSALSRADGEPISIALPGGTESAALLFAAARTASSVVVYLANDQVIEYDTASDTAARVDISFENVDHTIKDGAMYSNRLYLLDTKNDDILRHDRTGGVYAKGVAWLDDKSISVANGVSLDVDGSVYVLNDDGTVNKYFAGTLQAYSIDATDPVLEHPTKIVAQEGDANLYILDPDNKRLVVFSKAGRFLRQNTSESFTDLKDVTVDEKVGHAYVLSGNTVYEIALGE